MPCTQFFVLTATTTLQWSAAKEVALFFTLAGATAVPASALFKPLVQRVGLMRLGIVMAVMRGLSTLLLGASVMLVGASDTLCGSTLGVVVVTAVALFSTISNTFYMSFQSVAVLVRFSRTSRHACSVKFLCFLLRYFDHASSSRVLSRSNGRTAS